MERENDIISKELIEMNNEVVALNKQVAELQQRIDSHIFTMLVLENPQNGIEQFIKALKELQLSKGELKKVEVELENTMCALAQNEKKVETIRNQ